MGSMCMCFVVQILCVGVSCAPSFYSEYGVLCYLLFVDVCVPC